MAAERLRLIVKPGSSRGPLIEAAPEGSHADLVVAVRGRAVDGNANEAVIRVLADHLGLPKSSLRIVHGHTARHKVVEVG